MALSFDLLQDANLLLVRMSVVAPDHVGAGRVAPNFVTTPIRIGQSLRALELALRTAACSGVSRTRTPGCSVIALDRDDHVATSNVLRHGAYWTQRHHPGSKTATIPL